MEEKKPFGLLFKQIHIAFENSLQRQAQALDLTPAQADILIYLFTHPDHAVNQKELEQHLQLSNPTVTGILNRMESKGFIQRVSSAEDRRVKFIVPTAKACNTDLQLHQHIDQMEQKILKGFQAEEEALLYEALTKVLKNIAQ